MNVFSFNILLLSFLHTSKAIVKCNGNVTKVQLCSIEEGTYALKEESEMQSNFALVNFLRSV